MLASWLPILELRRERTNANDHVLWLTQAVLRNLPVTAFDHLVGCVDHRSQNIHIAILPHWPERSLDVKKNGHHDVRRQRQIQRSLQSVIINISSRQGRWAYLRTWMLVFTPASKSMWSELTPAVIHMFRFCAWECVSTENGNNATLSSPIPSDHQWGNRGGKVVINTSAS